MTQTDPVGTPPHDPGPRRARRPIPASATGPSMRAVAAVRDLCPYLLAADGSWRSAGADRDHACAAVGASPAPLTIEKQRRLCLTASHVTCPAYLVATGLEPTARTGEPIGPQPGTRPYPRMAPVALDHGRLTPTISMIRDGRTAQMALVGFLGIAFVALLIARLPGDPDGFVAVGAASPTPEASVVATARPTVRPTATPEPSAVVVESAEPTAAPTATPAPTPDTTPAPTLATRSYKVRSGDTLSGIAAEFGTTVRVLKRLNDIDDPSRLRVGQVLKIPN